MKALIVNKNYKLYFIVTFFSFCTIFSIFIFNGYIVLKQIDSIDLKIIGKNQQSQGYEIWFKPENISEFKIISGDFVSKENNVSPFASSICCVTFILFFVSSSKL